MRWRRFIGAAVVLAAAGCRTESAQSSANAAVGEATSAAPSAQSGSPSAQGSARAGADEAAGGAPSAQGSAKAAANEGAAGASSAEVKDKAPSAGKPAAPVNVVASIRPGAAQLDVTFGDDGRDVVIKVWGVDGLRVTKGGGPVSIASVTRGQSVKVGVELEAPAAESNLAVSVSGTFGGREQVRTQSFTVNMGAPTQAPPAGSTTVDKDGRRVKVMK